MRKARRLAIALVIGVIGAWLVLGAMTASAAMTAHVRIVENETTHRYQYKPIKITVHKGDKVVWNNQSDAPHTVTFGSGYDKRVNQGKTVSRVFKKVGTFKYHCRFHTYMHGTVVVTK